LIIPTVADIMDDLKAYIRLHHPLLTDWSPLSALSTISEAIAIQIYKMYVTIEAETEKINILTATGDDLSKLVLDRLPAGRQPGTQASGFLTFSRESVALTPVLVPIGTIVQVASGDGKTVKLQTTSLGTISVGTMTCIVTAMATEVGTSGNIGSYSATYLPVPVAGGSLAVINTAPFVGGTDAEEDELLRLRYQAINQEYGTATELLIAQHLLDLEPVYESHVYSLGYGDIEVIVDYDKTGIVEDHETEIGACLKKNMAAGIVARGAVAASIYAGVPLTNITQCEGGGIWVRPLQDITTDDSLSVAYIEKTTGETRTTAITVPAMTLKGSALSATTDLATSVPDIIYTGNKNYDILIGTGTYPYLFISPRLVPLIVTVTILTTDTPSPTLKNDIESSIIHYLDTYSIGDGLQYSDMYESIWRDYQTGIAFIGIDALISLVISGNLQSISSNGETILIGNDQRIEAGLVECVIVSP
jgi:hypothetical protein